MTISYARSVVVIYHLAAIIVLANGIFVATDAASAKDGQPWTVQGGLLGEQKKKGGYKASEDVSGLACADTSFPKLCIIVDDETQGAQVVILKEGILQAGEFIPLISNTFDNEPLELDAEGVAYAEGAFYVIGSYGRPRHEAGKPDEKSVARAEAARQVFRITGPLDSVDMETGRLRAAWTKTPSSKLSKFISAHRKLTDWFDKPLENNGLTIEGIAVKDQKLYIGMRAPLVDGNKAVILEIPAAAVFEGGAGDARLHELDLGNDTQGKARGVRDLVLHMGHFLVLAGPVEDPKDDAYEIQDGDYTIYSWSGSRATLDGKFNLKGYGKKAKPEAIVPLEGSAQSFRALILFDGPDNGGPRPVMVELR